MSAETPRNGSTPKRIKTQHGEVDIHTPRDREDSFEPQFIKKKQTRLTQMDEADVSATLISRVKDRVLEQITQGQSSCPVSQPYTAKRGLRGG